MAVRARGAPRGAATTFCIHSCEYCLVGFTLSCREDTYGEVSRDIRAVRLSVVVRDDDHCVAGLRFRLGLSRSIHQLHHHYEIPCYRSGLVPASFFVVNELVLSHILF